MIEVIELCKYYGERKAAGPLSFSIDRGEIVGLLGLNGAGKTTALRVLACDLLPSSGTARVDGIDVVEEPHEVRRRIGYLPETPPLYPEMTVHEYLVFAARLRGVTSAAAEGAADRAEDAVQLGAVRDQVIGSLSLGFRQRVGIAQAVVHRPQLLILDEPITGLDPAQIIEMRQLLRELRSDHTIILSSHILTEISETCDRILVLRAGEIVASGKESELSRSMASAVEVEITVRADGASPAGAGAAAAGTATATVQGLLERVPGVTSVRAIPPRELGPGVTSYRVEADRDVREAIARALVGAGVGVLEVVRSKRELETIFLRLTGAEPETRGIA
ncbi:MAG: ABC transporter ATP-binding protein [Myxococcales bacterium]|nr:ABC transporter ATP-binding protein [Myxococcales bacterium]